MAPSLLVEKIQARCLATNIEAILVVYTLLSMNILPEWRLFVSIVTLKENRLISCAMLRLPSDMRRSKDSTLDLSNGLSFSVYTCCVIRSVIGGHI